MVSKMHIDSLCAQLGLTPYQTYVLQTNCYKYDLARLVKRGGVLCAPYIEFGMRARFARMFVGPRVDLIGMDKILVRGERRVKIYAAGFFRARENGVRYYADAYGNRVHRDLFVDTIRRFGR